LNFDLVRPCPTCPFRVGGEAIRKLRPGRGDEIADILLSDGSFLCHEDESQHCCGAMIILEKLEQPNQMMRIAERTGGYDHNKLVDRDQVFDDFDSWIEVVEA